MLIGSQVANAIDAGASGVLFTNIFESTIPRTVGYAYVRSSVGIPVCTITKEVERFSDSQQVQLEQIGVIRWLNLDRASSPMRNSN